MNPQTLPNPFSTEGAKRISEITGQKLATSPIDISTLTTPTTIQTPPLSTPTFNAASIVMPAIQNTARQDELDAEGDQILADIEAGNAKLATKSARRVELEGAQGIPQLNKDLQELFDQAKQIDAASLNMQVKSEDRLAPTFAIRGEQAQIERQASAKKAGIAAIASAMTGKLALAQDYVDQALAAEFDPEEKLIEHKKFLLSINKDKFEGEEKRRAEQRAEELTEQRRALDNARADKAGVYEVAKIIAPYAPADVLSQVLGKGDIAQAMTAAGAYMQDPMAKYQLEAAKWDVALKKLQVEKTTREIGQIGQPTKEELKELQAKTERQTAAQSRAKQVLALVNELQSNSTIKNSVIGFRGPRALFGTPGAQDYLNKVDRLRSILAIDAIKDFKGTGPMSDREFATASAAATSINVNRDKSRISGTTQAFNDELERIKQSMLTVVGEFAPDESALLDQLYADDAMTISSPASSLTPGADDAFMNQLYGIRR